MVDILAVRGEEGRMLDSEMLRGAVKQASNRRYPNGETRWLETIKHSMVSKVAIEERT